MAKILLVQGDRDFACSLGKSLSRERHRVDVASDAAEATIFLKTYEYDLIILDWLPAVLSGPEICRNFRNSGGKAAVLMLSCKANVDDKEIGLDSGADDYMCKPCDPRELSARIRALLRRPAQFAVDLIKIGDLSLDRNLFQVSKGGVKLKLMPMEFALLEFLARHPGRVFNKEALLDLVWPPQAEASLEAVRTCMKTLRKKIGDRSGRPLIRNIHGVGYVLEPPLLPEDPSFEHRDCDSSKNAA
jgi:DNA-binding response OmpR family regulator